MLWRDMTWITTALILFAIVNIGALFSQMGILFPRFYKVAAIIGFIASAGLFVWLLFNKELFHWNFDIATGEPVDHYSTYYSCLIKTVIAGVISVVNIILRAIKEKRG